MKEGINSCVMTKAELISHLLSTTKRVLPSIHTNNTRKIPKIIANDVMDDTLSQELSEITRSFSTFQLNNPYQPQTKKKESCNNPIPPTIPTNQIPNAIIDNCMVKKRLFSPYDINDNYWQIDNSKIRKLSISNPRTLNTNEGVHAIEKENTVQHNVTDIQNNHSQEIDIGSVETFNSNAVSKPAIKSPSSRSSLLSRTLGTLPSLKSKDTSSEYISSSEVTLSEGKQNIDPTTCKPPSSSCMHSSAGYPGTRNNCAYDPLKQLSSLDVTNTTTTSAPSTRSDNSSASASASKPHLSPGVLSKRWCPRLPMNTFPNPEDICIEIYLKGNMELIAFRSAYNLFKLCDKKECIAV